MQLLLILVLLVIIVSLGRALYYLIYDGPEQTRVVKALAGRVGLSLGLFALLVLSFYMGWIEPHALGLSSIR